MRAVGAVLAHRRRELGLTQADLGQLAGASQYQISEWERGKRNIRLGSLVRLGAALRLQLVLIQIDVTGA